MSEDIYNIIQNILDVYHCRDIKITFCQSFCEVAINRYVDLMRIKAHETGENKELDYQIKVAKVKLSIFGIDYADLEF